MYDTIIIGKGPAGISSALYALRGGLSVCIIASGFGALEKADKIDNYYGINSISGKALAEQGELQAYNLGAEIVNAEVVDISYDGNFSISTPSNNYTAKTVIIATGVSRKTAQIKGLASLEGSGVSYCAICDGFFYRGKTVGVLGNGEYALHEINSLLPLAKKAYLFTDGVEPTVVFPENVEIIKTKIVSVNGVDSLEGVSLADNNTISIDGLFVALGQASANALAMKLGVETEKNFIVTNSQMMTNIDGLFACGDCVGGLLQVSKSVSDGAKAGTNVVKFIKNGNNFKKS